MRNLENYRQKISKQDESNQYIFHAILKFYETNSVKTI